ncbi:MAG: membrane protein insertion efficiency factor YidD, partial [Spartobacteria bacterium]|nr:membrane protein insertion efficiency factor YidD [Spartobacteria bacterium]
SVLSLPGAWVTRFYRTQIRPAIGDRCELHPSCSEYFRQACGKHGLLGFTIYADRGVREPDVVKYQEEPVMIDGTIKFADPLEAHDWWMKE